MKKAIGAIIVIIIIIAIIYYMYPSLLSSIIPS
jgi:hypothetical protein